VRPIKGSSTRPSPTISICVDVIAMRLTREYAGNASLPRGAVSPTHAGVRRSSAASRYGISTRNAWPSPLLTAASPSSSANEGAGALMSTATAYAMARMRCLAERSVFSTMAESLDGRSVFKDIF
jgi:hypothetical protein